MTDTTTSIGPSLGDRVDLVKSQIANLQFQVKILTSAGDAVRLGFYDEIMDEARTRESRISELHAHLQELLSGTHSTLPSSINTHSEIRHRHACSITSLPMEMLASVFKHAPVDPDQRVEFAVSVSSVSRYWHETAMQTLFLWSGIPLWGGSVHSGKRYQEFLILLLQRSNLHPIDITAYLTAEEGGDGFLAQLDIAITSISRWRSFIYRGFYPNRLIAHMEPFIPLHAPILEFFDLYIEFLTSEEYQDLNLFEGGAPLLSHIRIGVLPPICLPPLASLTSLYLEAGIHPITFSYLSTILQSSPALVSLTLVGETVDPDSLCHSALEGRKVKMVSLRLFKFTAVASPKYYIECMLNAICCPAIESMIITAQGAEDSLLYDLLYERTASLPLHSYPAMRSLELDGIACDKFAQNFNFTQLLPVLDTISLTGDCKSPLSLLRLSLLPSTDRPDTDNVWPLLRVIKLSHLTADDYEDLCEILSHRQACGRPVEMIEIDPRSLGLCPPKKVEWMKQRVVTRRGQTRASHYPKTDLVHLL